MRYLAIGTSDSALAAAVRARANDEAATIVVFEQSGTEPPCARKLKEVYNIGLRLSTKVLAVEGVLVRLEDMLTGRVYEEKFDGVINPWQLQPGPVARGAAFGEPLELLVDGAGDFERIWAKTARHAAEHSAQTALVKGGGLTAIRLAARLRAQNIETTLALAGYPALDGIDYDVAAYLRKALHRGGVRIRPDQTPDYAPDHAAGRDHTHDHAHNAYPNENELILHIANDKLKERDILTEVEIFGTRHIRFGLNESELTLRMQNYIYSVWPIQNGFIKLIYGENGQIHAAAAIGESVWTMNTLFVHFSAASYVKAAANMRLLGPGRIVNKLAGLAMDVLEKRLAMAYWDEIARPDFEKITLLDVQTPEAFAANNLAGSINIPLQTLRENHYRLDKSKEIITICAGGEESPIAAKILMAAGFKARQLTGGIDYIKTVNC